MRANTKKKQKMGKRFAIVIGVAAAGVMALGAQTAFAAPTYNTRLTITGGPRARYLRRRVFRRREEVPSLGDG